LENLSFNNIDQSAGLFSKPGGRASDSRTWTAPVPHAADGTVRCGAVRCGRASTPWVWRSRARRTPARGAAIVTGSTPAAKPEGPLRLSWWIRAPRSIRCIPLPPIRRQARINHRNPTENPIQRTKETTGTRGAALIGRWRSGLTRTCPGPGGRPGDTNPARLSGRRPAVDGGSWTSRGHAREFPALSDRSHVAGTRLMGT
jgi:hypothetical protein